MDCRWFKAGHCRSCELLDLGYQETLALKENKLKALFSGTELFLHPSVGLSAEQVAGSRNKAKLAVCGEGGELQFGFYDSALNFKLLEECPLHMPGLNELLPVLKRKLAEYKVPAYSIAQKTGELKYVILSESQVSNDILVRLVLRSKEAVDRLKKMAQSLQAEVPAVRVVTANIQPEHKAIMEGAEELVLTAEEKITHQFGEVVLSLGPRSFFQVTPAIASDLYHAVGAVVKEYKLQSFLDLYCGVGAFSFFAAKYCPNVLGVEISKEAINSAQSCIAVNRPLNQVNFVALDVEVFLTSLKEKYEAILVNPPRRGLNEMIIQGLLQQGPKVIIYSSCNAVTLARDLQLLSREYVICRTQIFDMFPYTEHYETLMVLNRRDA